MRRRIDTIPLIADPSALLRHAKFALLRQAITARLSSIHQRASEMDFPGPQRALEVQPEPAVNQGLDQPETPYSDDLAQQAQHAQQVPADVSQVTGVGLRRLSAGNMHEASADAATGSCSTGPSRRKPAHTAGQVTEAPRSPGTPAQKRKATQGSALMLESARPSCMHAACAASADVHAPEDERPRDRAGDAHVTSEGEQNTIRLRQQALSGEHPVFQPESLRPPSWKAKRRRIWRSDANNPPLQPPAKPVVASGVERAVRESEDSTPVRSLTSKRRKLEDRTTVRLPTSKSIGVPGCSAAARLPRADTRE